MELERLQKFMARSGVASRRRSEELIKEGKVTVNGNVITESDVLPLTRNREKQAKAVYSGERLSKEIYNYRKEVYKTSLSA